MLGNEAISNVVDRIEDKLRAVRYFALRGVNVTEEELRQAHAILDDEMSSADQNKKALVSFQEQAARELLLLMTRAADQVMF